ENEIRDEIVAHGRSMFARGLTSGSTGNLSARVEDGVIVTPTGASLGDLDPARLSKLDHDGRHVSGDPPTKEASLHTAVYAQRSAAAAVVHLHSTHAVAVSCLDDVDPADALPPLTPYFVMRVGVLPMIPYFPPGDDALADAVEAMAATHHAILMANHGTVVAGKTMADAVYATEELEETAKLFLMLHGRTTRPLTPAQVDVLRNRFPIKA
ncbi:MAG: 3-oxo-tetronate 4-phosphate decarboxylase, partial [Pseudomonadota bacterium]